MSIEELMESRKNISPKIPRDSEKGLMENIQGDIPLAARPFLEISRNTGSSESEVIAAVRKLKEDKVIRRFGAIIRHQKAGFSENAILLVSAGEENPERIGEQLASFREISHCYQREPQFMGRYGIFAMVHARQGKLEGLVKNIVSRTGIRDYLVLPSTVEFKKTSLEPV
jgi:siroheme decarboxylase